MTIAELLTEWAQLEPERCKVSLIAPATVFLRHEGRSTTLRFNNLERGSTFDCALLEYHLRDAILARDLEINLTIERGYSFVTITNAPHEFCASNPTPAHALLEAYVSHLKGQA